MKAYSNGLSLNVMEAEKHVCAKKEDIIKY